MPQEKDGASLIANMLINEATHINIWAGTAVNPAHQNPNFPKDLNIKLNMIADFNSILGELGKVVQVKYL